MFHQGIREMRSALLPLASAIGVDPTKNGPPKFWGKPAYLPAHLPPTPIG